MCWAHTSFTQKKLCDMLSLLCGLSTYWETSATDYNRAVQKSPSGDCHCIKIHFLFYSTSLYVTIRSNSHLCIDVSVHLREEKHCLPPNNCAAAGRSRNIGRRVKVSVILWPTPQRVTTQNIIAPLFHILGIKWLNGKSWDKMSSTILMLSL